MDHPDLGDVGFAPGRWLGWVYLDPNRPDLFPRVLRFCCVDCCRDWLDGQKRKREHLPLGPLDEPSLGPRDQLSQRRRAVAARPSTAAR